MAGILSSLKRKIKTITFKKIPVEIPTVYGNLLDGKFPKKELKLVEAWSIIHKKELEANWLLSKNCEKLFEIRPLS